MLRDVVHEKGESTKMHSRKIDNLLKEGSEELARVKRRHNPFKHPLKKIYLTPHPKQDTSSRKFDIIKQASFKDHPP